MNQRSQILPTIANSLGGVSSRAETGRLKAAAARVLSTQSRLRPAVSNVPDENQSRDKSVLTATLQERLWAATRTRLFDRDATRTFRPLRLGQAHAHIQPEDIMLDDLYITADDDTEQVLFSDTDDEDAVMDPTLFDDIDSYDDEEEEGMALGI